MVEILTVGEEIGEEVEEWERFRREVVVPTLREPQEGVGLSGSCTIRGQSIDNGNC